MHSILKTRTIALLTILLIPMVQISWHHSPMTAAAQTVRPTIEVSIEAGRKGDIFRVNGRRTSAKKLAGAIESATVADRDKTIIDVICDDDVSMSSVFGLRKLLIDQNLLRVRFSNPTDKPVPHVLPSPAMAERLREMAPRNIATLEIDESGAVTHDGEKVELSDVAAIIGRKVDSNSLLIVSVHASVDTHYGNFLKVLAELRKVKAHRVIIHDPTAE